MHVVAARVHDARDLGRVLEAGVLGDRQGVDVGAGEHRGTGAVLDHPDDAGVADPVHCAADALELLGDASGRRVLLGAEFGMSMELGVELPQVREALGQGVERER